MLHLYSWGRTTKAQRVSFLTRSKPRFVRKNENRRGERLPVSPFKTQAPQAFHNSHPKWEKIKIKSSNLINIQIWRPRLVNSRQTERKLTPSVLPRASPTRGSPRPKYNFLNKTEEKRQFLVFSTSPCPACTRCSSFCTQRLAEVNEFTKGFKVETGMEISASRAKPSFT